MASPSQDRLFGANSSLAIKAPVKVATTANITLSGLQTIDGVALATDDRVLVKDQTDPVYNGIYIADTSTWDRAPDFDGQRDIRQGTLVLITQGTTQALTIWRISTANPIVINTTEIDFELFLGSSGSSTFTDVTVTGTLTSAQAIQWLAFDLTGLDALLVADTGLFEQIVKPCTILDAYASSKTGTTTGAVIFDIHGNGTTILGNKITIDATETSSLDAGTQPTIATTSFVSPWRMRLDCDDDGDGTMTGPVVVCLKVRWAT